MYSDSARRPFGDIDLCVRPDQFGEAERLLKELSSVHCDVDLHSGFTKFYESALDDEVWSRTRLINVDGADIRILSDEDQLRYVCLHLLRHGANRVLWGCDIGVALEARPDNFDWDLVFRGSEQERNWVSTAIALAVNLLGARLTSSPPSVAAHTVPAWIESLVLSEWGKVFEFPAPLALSAGQSAKDLARTSQALSQWHHGNRQPQSRVQGEATLCPSAQ